MNDVTVRAEHVTVAFRPFADRKPTLRRSLAPGRKRLQERVVALDDVTFDVMRGEAFGIVGRNGAGKSTLLRVLAGTLRPNAGEVHVAGRISTLLQLGVGFNNELSGRRNIYLGALAAGIRKVKIDEMLEDIIEYAEIEDAIDRPIKTYSSGMFARLAFSVAMHLDPDVLLVDEVLAVGDEAFREKSMASMDALLERSATVIFVSHNLSRVEEFCSRAMWLHGGRVRAIGDPTEVIDQYRDWSLSTRKPA